MDFSLLAGFFPSLSSSNEYPIQQESKVPTLLSQCITCVARHIDLATNLQHVPISIIQRLMQQSIQRKKLTERSVYIFLESTTEHTALDFSDHHWLTDKTLKLLAKQTHLHSLNLRNCNKLTGATISQIVQNCPLTELNLSCCHQINNPTLKTIAEKLSLNLYHLNINGCFEISNEGLHRIIVLLITKGLESLAKHCPNLSQVNFGYLQNISDSGINSFTEGCRQIQYLTLNYCINLHDTCFENLAQRLVLLRQLSIVGCKHLTDRSLSWIAGHCQLLENISLAECVGLTDLSVQLMAQYCVFLHTIDISQLNNITNQAVMALATSGRPLVVLRMKKAFNITNEVLEALISNMAPTIEVMDLSGCIGLADSTLTLLASCNQLKELDISFCTKVTEKGATQLIKSSPRLQKVAMWGHRFNFTVLHSINPNVHIDHI